MRIERRAEWDDSINDWIIPNVELTGNNLKIQKAKKKEGKDGGAFGNSFFENILNMEESEDEDFETAATKRVNEAISSILNEEEEEVGMQFIPPEKMSVYFKYTDDGAVREDPESEAKREKNKKKRL